MTSSSSSDTRSAQHRKDTARIINTMVPGLAPPLVSLCLNYCFGPEAPKTPNSRLASFSSRSGSPSLGKSAALASPSMEVTSRFKLRRMDSGPMGEHSLVDPIVRHNSADKYGFGGRADMFKFDLVL